MQKILKADTPPDHLSSEAKAIHIQVNSEIVLPSDALLTLRVALEQFDIAQEARQILSREGLVVTSKAGMVRKHPATEILKNATGQFLSAMRLLGLDKVEPGPIGRPTR